MLPVAARGGSHIEKALRPRLMAKAIAPPTSCFCLVQVKMFVSSLSRCVHAVKSVKLYVDPDDGQSAGKIDPATQSMSPA